MDRKQFIDALFARAQAEGFDGCEVFLADSDTFSVNVFQGEIVDYSVSSSFGLGFRGLFGGRMGCASTQGSTAAIELLVRGRGKRRADRGDDPEELFPGARARPPRT